METDFITFKVFNDVDTANDLADTLQQSGISCVVEEDAVNFDPSYANNPFNKDYRVKVRFYDFEKANKALQQYYRTKLNEVDEDYYLFEFTDDELQEIIAKPDEWGEFDYQLAQKLLANRGKEIDVKQKQDLKEKRLLDLAQTAAASKGSIAAAYVFGLLFSPLGIFMGWNWAYAKTTLPTGQRVYTYNDHTRKHGRTIFALAVALFITLLLYRIGILLLNT